MPTVNGKRVMNFRILPDDKKWLPIEVLI
jgi:hypothetical protein